MWRYWLVLGGTWSIWGVTGWYLVVLGQYRAVLVGNFWNWDSIGRYWLVLGGTGTVWGSTGSLRGGIGQYLVVLGQYRAELVIHGQRGAVLPDTWWYLVSMWHYWFVLGGTGSEWGGAGWYSVKMGQYWAIVADTCWYWVTMGRYWLVHGGTGSV